MTTGSAFSQTKTVAGATFSSQMDIKGTKLIYNGAGLREKYSFDLYVAALYLSNQTKDGATVINADEIQVINIKLVSNKVTRDKFNETVKDGFEKVSDGKATTAEI